jgi:hypothetical protein
LGFWLGRGEEVGVVRGFAGNRTFAVLRLAPLWLTGCVAVNRAPAVRAPSRVDLSTYVMDKSTLALALAASVVLSTHLVSE